LIYCDQDIKLIEGYDYNKLQTAIQHLNKYDTEWAVAGNVGGMDNLDICRHIIY